MQCDATLLRSFALHTEEERLTRSLAIASLLHPQLLLASSFEQHCNKLYFPEGRCEKTFFPDALPARVQYVKLFSPSSFSTQVSPAKMAPSLLPTLQKHWQQPSQMRAYIYKALENASSEEVEIEEQKSAPLPQAKRGGSGGGARWRWPWISAAATLWLATAWLFSFALPRLPAFPHGKEEFPSFFPESKPHNYFLRPLPSPLLSPHNAHSPSIA